ncbi:jg1451 [Pararge aegeria aegeria]|uniref:Jg1451 protein n=1 Tax=Pararge aegeria aegeria TaxID=348720 RepID=A0A8S4QFB8_9NEOP|nr:jg1451 [Pararge aegeria aegeria]
MLGIEPGNFLLIIPQHLPFLHVTDAMLSYRPSSGQDMNPGGAFSTIRTTAPTRPPRQWWVRLLPVPSRPRDVNMKTFGVETLGPWGSEARALFKELSKRVIESTGDPRAGSYLGQRISLAILRGNAASILGTVPRCGGSENVLDFI